MKMTMEVLDIIHVVLDYKNFIRSQNRLKQFHVDNFDWFSETEKYYYSLSLPEGMSHNRTEFERILSYGSSRLGIEELKKLDDAEELELCDFEW